MLTGTWCSPEIMKVLAMGYRLILIHEVWHFPESQTGLFEGYVNTWLKLKQESSRLTILGGQIQMKRNESM